MAGLYKRYTKKRGITVKVFMPCWWGKWGGGNGRGGEGGSEDQRLISADVHAGDVGWVYKLTQG